MIINKGGGFYSSPYNATFYTGISKQFNAITIPTTTSYFNVPFQQSQQTYKQSQQLVINQQNHENISNIPSFKFYDLDTNNDHEIIRLLFSFGGIAYKNKRYKQDEWNKAKEQATFENLPLLRINNRFTIFQLNTIIRYLAREFHLYGIGQTDHAIVDMVYETSYQFREKLFEKTNDDSTYFSQKLRQVTTDHSATYLKQLEKYYEIFQRPGPFYLGSHLSLADLIVYDTISYIIKIEKKILDSYPHLKEARRCIEKYPRLFNYMNTKNDNNDIKETKIQNQYSVSSQHAKTESPVENAPSQNHHQHHRRHHHRHPSHDEHETHYHHRHHDHHHHHHHHHNNHLQSHSKEQLPISQKEQQSVQQSQSPNITTKDEEPTQLSQKKQRSVQQSQSSTTSVKDKEPTPSLQVKQRAVRSSKSPTKSTKDKERTASSKSRKRSVRSSKSPLHSNTDKEATPLRTADVIPPQPSPPVNAEHKLPSTNN